MEYMYIYIYIKILVCTCIHILIEKATASAADLWDPSEAWMPGCLDAWMLGACLFACLDADLRRMVPFGLHWSSQGAQRSYLLFLCRRKHRFREICRFWGQKVDILWRPVAPWGEKIDILWRPVAAFCYRVHPL